ncbi:MAG: hypothetical protein L0L18_10825 [Acidipropionibacterium jensenii]|uniref:hypothetical protein n=1 Tax=Corynebacterium variabile TaxID=1727 RepID=UPI00264D5A78|nr:hypothetical protein [Acidipropionibacterium jensenii]
MEKGSGESSISQSVLELIVYGAVHNMHITRTKVLKLLYLVDLRAVDEGLTCRSGIDWEWYNYGPFDRAVLAVEDTLVQVGAVVKERRQSASGTEYFELVPAPQFQPRQPGTFGLDRRYYDLLVSVMDAYGHLTAKQLGDFAYKTPPMLLAQDDDGARGVKLDMSLGLAGDRRTSRDKLRGLRRLRTRRQAVRGQQDEGDLSQLRDEVAAVASARRAATRTLVGSDEQGA